MKRSLAYITAAWCGEDYKNTEQAARYCRAVYEAGFSPICPTLYLPLFLNDAVPEEHKNGIDMSRDLLRRSHVLVVCGHTVTEAMPPQRWMASSPSKDRGGADMDTPFEAYVTNLGKYNEGRLVGENLKFPTTTEEVQALLKRIGIDGVRYEEIFITDYEVNISGLYDCLGEYESIDELNYLASLISEMNQSDREKFEAVIDSGEYSGSVKELINLTQNLDCFEFYAGVEDDETLGRKELINLTQNLDCFEFYAGVEDDETLGRIYVEDMEAIDVPEHLLNYFDYEAYGRDIRINDDGHYANGGYMFNNGSQFIEHYTGRDDIPDEYRVFSMPKLNIREQMAAYKEVADRAAPEKDHLLPKKEVPER